jgi:hypothetical protein
MRWGTSFKSKLARLAFAYTLAFQALLGAWAGIAVTANAQALDPSLSLCRTVTSGDAQQSDDAAPTHCAVMCLIGACAAGDPPTVLSAAAEYSPPRVAVLSSHDRTAVPSTALLLTLSARGPPPIV